LKRIAGNRTVRLRRRTWCGHRSSGTPGGVGAARTPPVWLADGDEVAVDIAGIGVLVNQVRAD